VHLSVEFGKGSTQGQKFCLILGSFSGRSVDFLQLPEVEQLALVIREAGGVAEEEFVYFDGLGCAEGLYGGLSFLTFVFL
jgi:hypothetical protein